MSEVISLNGHAISSDAERGIDLVKVIEQAPHIAYRLREHARIQTGAPKGLRFDLAAGAVTIKVLHDELAKAQLEVKNLKVQNENLRDEMDHL